MKKIYKSILTSVALAGTLSADSFETRSLLTDLYRGISGETIAHADEMIIRDRGGDPRYGEITFEGIEKLVQEVPFTDQDIFYDLGSGVGKMVVQVYFDTPVLKSVGIELSLRRFQAARQVKNKIRERKLIDPHRRLLFFHKNILDIHLKDATILYSNTFSMAPELKQRLVKKIMGLKPGARVITTQLLEHERLMLKKMVIVPMTWDPEVPLYVYELQPEQDVP